jgi:hypothetical protein
MKPSIAALLAAGALFLAPAAFAADAVQQTLSLRFSRDLGAIFAEAAEHRQIVSGEHQMVLAENPATNVLLARRNRDGSITIGCFDDAESARRFFARTPAVAVPGAESR